MNSHQNSWGNPRNLFNNFETNLWYEFSKAIRFTREGLWWLKSAFAFILHTRLNSIFYRKCANPFSFRVFCAWAALKTTWKVSCRMNSWKISSMLFWEEFLNFFLEKILVKILEIMAGNMRRRYLREIL